MAETVEVKKQIGTDRADGKKMDGSVKKMMDASSAVRAAKRRDERKQILEEWLKENIEKINNMKKSKLYIVIF